jgi:hypothetical protein
MKKIVLTAAFAALALLAGVTVYQANSRKAVSDLAMANVNALAEGESSEDFTKATGCIAVWEDVTCNGSDGNIYSYARD